MIVYGGPDRRPITLGPELAHGGQGIIHAVESEDNLLAKIYFKPAPSDLDRLQWMVDNPPPRLGASGHHATMAWPQTLLYDGHADGKFIGFVMPRVRASVLVLNLITPKIRARQLPNFDWKYLHRAARNLAIAVGVVHHSDYVVGDLNESNVLVTAAALVTIIDVDSFQTVEIRSGQRIIHPCPVGKPEYTAPELQDAELSHVLRTNEHDGFALAVLVFQLLMAGRHPFQSVWKGMGDPPSIAEKIHRGLFPYAGPNSSRVAPPANSTLEVLHPTLRALIVRCFVDGQSDPLRRPAPDEWDAALAEAEVGLVSCRFGHSYLGHLNQCPECNQERLAREAARVHAQLVRRPVTPARANPRGQPAAAPMANRSPLAGFGLVLGVLLVLANLVVAIANGVSSQRAVATTATGRAAVATSKPSTPNLVGLGAPSATSSTAPAASATMPAPSPTASLTSTAPAASTTILAPSPTASLPSPLLSPRVGILASTSLLAGPGHSFAVLQSILLGTVVDLIGRSPDAIWLYVTVVQSGMRGWIESRYVKVPYNVTRLPIQVFLPATARP